MNPPPESRGRDALAEIDEFTQLTQAAFKQIGESFDLQREVNVSFNDAMTECFKVVSSLEEKIISLQERIAALEDGYRLILP